jgi:hypothetical protein
MTATVMVVAAVVAAIVVMITLGGQDQSLTL